MPSTARSAACLALLLGLAGGLSACGGSAEPSTMPSSSGSTTPSASPTGPVEPVLPEAAKANTKAAAVAFVRYYVDLINYAQATGDVDGLRAASDPACVLCDNVADTLFDLYDRGGHLSGGDWSITNMEVFATGDASWGSAVRVRTTAQTVTRKGQQEQHVVGARSSQSFALMREDAGWVVKTWSRID